MTLDALFLLSNNIASLGWLCLLAGLLLQGRSNPSPRLASTVRGLLLLGGRAIPIVLSVLYTACIFIWWRGSEGDFGSLNGLIALFNTRGLMVAGWVHYLAFDLWLGRWQIDALQNYTEARPEGVTHTPWILRLLLIPCLALTFFFGPIGLLVFLAIMRLQPSYNLTTRKIVW